MGTVKGCEALEPYLEKSGAGSVIVMSSTARTIVFLASPASAYTTGTTVVIDGGYTKRVQF